MATDSAQAIQPDKFGISSYLSILGKFVTNTAYFAAGVENNSALIQNNSVLMRIGGGFNFASEAIDFAKKIQARTAFGIHDGMIMPNFRGFIGMAIKMFVPGTEYVALADGESKEF